METNTAAALHVATPQDAFEDLCHQVIAPRIEEALEQLAAIYEFTDKERKVLALLFDGLCSKEVAAQLGKSTKCIKHYMGGIYRKTGASGRHRLFAMVMGRPLPLGVAR